MNILGIFLEPVYISQPQIPVPLLCYCRYRRQNYYQNQVVKQNGKKIKNRIQSWQKWKTQPTVNKKIFKNGN